MVRPAIPLPVLLISACLGIAGWHCYDGRSTCQTAGDCFKGEACAPASKVCVPCSTVPARIAEKQGCALEADAVDVPRDADSDDLRRPRDGNGGGSLPRDVEDVDDGVKRPDSDSDSPDTDVDGGCESVPADDGLSWRCPETATIDYDCDGNLPDEVSDAPGDLPSPVVYWPFNRKTTKNFPNRAGDEPTLVRSDDQGGSVRFEGDTVAGRAFRFEDGQYLKIDHHESFELSSGTIMFWFRITSPNMSELSDVAGLFSKDADGALQGGHLTILALGSTEDGVRVRAKLTSKTGKDWIPPQENLEILPRDTWHHVAVTFGSEGFQLYVNGTQTGATGDRKHGLWSNDGSVQNIQPLGIGVDRRRSGDGDFSGIRNIYSSEMDEIAVFDEQFDPRPYYDSCTDGS